MTSTQSIAKKLNAKTVEPIRIYVPGMPMAQPRQRHRIVQNSLGGQYAMNYLPKDSPVNQWKAIIRHEAIQAHSGAPLEGPVYLVLYFIFARTKGQVWKRKAMPRLWHTKTPDCDNVEKAVQDALTGILWRDDSQICSKRTDKFIASGVEQPGTDILVYALAEGVTDGGMVGFNS